MTSRSRTLLVGLILVSMLMGSAAKATPSRVVHVPLETRKLVRAELSLEGKLTLTPIRDRAEREPNEGELRKQEYIEVSGLIENEEFNASHGEAAKIVDLFKLQDRLFLVVRGGNDPRGPRYIVEVKLSTNAIEDISMAAFWGTLSASAFGLTIAIGNPIMMIPFGAATVKLRKQYRLSLRRAFGLNPSETPLTDHLLQLRRFKTNNEGNVLDAVVTVGGHSGKHMSLKRILNGQACVESLTNRDQPTENP